MTRSNRDLAVKAVSAAVGGAAGLCVNSAVTAACTGAGGVAAGPPGVAAGFTVGQALGVAAGAGTAVVVSHYTEQGINYVLNSYAPPNAATATLASPTGRRWLPAA